jgi:hypothetical protein
MELVGVHRTIASVAYEHGEQVRKTRAEVAFAAVVVVDNKPHSTLVRMMGARDSAAVVAAARKPASSGNCRRRRWNESEQCGAAVGPPVWSQGELCAAGKTN